MGVRVFVRQWTKDDSESEVSHEYSTADNWNFLKVTDDSAYLEVTEGNERVVAVFSQFNRVEVVDPPEDEDDEDVDE